MKTENNIYLSKKTEHFTIVESAYKEIMNTICKRLPESGGILLGNRENYIVRKFVFDPGGAMSPGGYDPDVKFINETLKKEWENNKLELLGFCHSHPRYVSRLSGNYGNNTGDVGYMKAIFQAIPKLNKFLVPIVYSPCDGGELKIFPYIAFRGQEENYITGELSIIKDSENTKIHVKELEEKFKFNPSKLIGSVDFDLMQKSKVVCIGLGGANGICESLVRSGLGSITLIDFDSCDSTNIVTQGFYINDIGKPKAEVLRERLLNINPDLNIKIYINDFTLLGEKLEDKIMMDTDLLLAMTDSFNAQAYANLIGLRYQVPTVFAMMYERARASEISFMIPGVTPACHRCATSSRYDAYEAGFENNVTSISSTNFHTTYLNSAIGLITLAILHRKTQGFEFSNWFGEYFDRNLVQIRMSPFFNSRLFSDLSLNNDRVYFMDTIWQRITPDAPPDYNYCPDCGGTGNLKDASFDKQSFCDNPII